MLLCKRFSNTQLVEGACLISRLACEGTVQSSMLEASTFKALNRSKDKVQVECSRATMPRQDEVIIWNNL